VKRSTPSTLTMSSKVPLRKKRLMTMAISSPKRPMNRKVPHLVRSICVVRPTMVIAPNRAAVDTKASVRVPRSYASTMSDRVKPFSAE